VQSSVSKFANLEALKRRTDEESLNRRASLHDSYGKPGLLGNLWNKYVVPGSATTASADVMQLHTGTKHDKTNDCAEGAKGHNNLEPVRLSIVPWVMLADCL